MRTRWPNGKAPNGKAWSAGSVPRVRPAVRGNPALSEELVRAQDVAGEWHEISNSDYRAWLQSQHDRAFWPA